MLNSFFQQPLWAILTECSVATRAVRAPHLVTAFFTAMVLLTTFCTDCFPSAVLLPVTKLLTFEATQWVRNVDCDWDPDITNFYMLRDSSLFECDYEGTGVFPAT